MAKILFAWELGAGLGHLTRQRVLAVRLKDRGHEVVLAVRDARSTAMVFADSDIVCLQAPTRVWRPGAQFRPPRTYAHLLHNVGFNDLRGVVGLTTAWRRLYELVNPDVIVFDHSPFALLAARSHPAKRVLLGTGFCSPPPTRPLPRFRPARDAVSRQLVRDENRVLGIANEVQRQNGLPALPYLGDLYGRIDISFLTTFRELDHFGPRKNPRYWGIQRSCPASPPNWPRARGKKVFAYLKRSRALPDLLRKLNEIGCPAIVYGDWVDDRVKRRFGSSTLALESRPLDIALIGQQCDLAILNATHGTTAEFLLYRVPILQLPIFVEQYITARNTVRIGAGLSAHRNKPGPVVERLEQLLASDDYRKAAQRFAAKYSKFDVAKALEEMVRQIERLVR